ncbi:MAG: rhomboid family intramembrane serine protease [Treponema sp.]|nr:rhomboid family intramembrane serine protease [Treponema sp.]
MNKPVFFRRPFKYSFFHVTILLILVNIVVYVAGRFYPMLDAYLSLNVGTVVYYKWYWQFFTYMFVHGNFSHILFNMLGLLFFGFNVERAWGSKEFLLFYLMSGFLSGVFSFLVYFFTGMNTVFLMGASGAIYSVLFAYAVTFPRSVIYIWGLIPVPAPILVLIYAVIEFFSQFFGGGNVAHMTHLFGFFSAWSYFRIRMGIRPLKIWKDIYKK